MSLIQAKKICKDFPGVRALDRVDFQVDAGSVHCLVGENGAGKSTLVKILTGVYTPDSGEVIIDGNNALEHIELFDKIAYVPQELSLFMHMTVAENLFMPFEKSGMGRHRLHLGEMYREAEKYIDRFHIHAHPDAKVSELTVSDRQLLQIARASTIQGFSVLILDEPTTSLTMKEVERFYSIVEELRDKGCGIVFISHKFEEIYHIGDETTVMRNGVNVGSGKLADIDQRMLVNLMSGEDIDTDERCQPELPPGDVVLEVEGLSGDGFSDISFSVREGEILGVAGLVGAGRSEIMQTLFGYLRESAGTVRMGNKPWKFRDTTFSIANGMYYLPEDRKTQGILPHLSVRMNIGISLLNQTVRGGVISGDKEKRFVTNIINDYGIKTPSMDQLISRLSGGNQQKAIIGRSIENRPKVMIIDEPTKGIDIRAKNEIYHLMKKLAEEQRVGIVMISSELKELMKCANRIMVIYHGAMNGTVEVVDPARQNQIVSMMLGVKDSE